MATKNTLKEIKFQSGFTMLIPTEKYGNITLHRLVEETHIGITVDRALQLQANRIDGDALNAEHERGVFAELFQIAPDTIQTAPAPQGIAAVQAVASTGMPAPAAPVGPGQVVQGRYGQKGPERTPGYFHVTMCDAYLFEHRTKDDGGEYSIMRLYDNDKSGQYGERKYSIMSWKDGYPVEGFRDTLNTDGQRASFPQLMYVALQVTTETINNPGGLGHGNYRVEPVAMSYTEAEAVPPGFVSGPVVHRAAPVTEVVDGNEYLAGDPGRESEGESIPF